MIKFFRSLFETKLGLFLTLGFVALIAIAFATADVSGSGAFGGVTDTGTVAHVGDAKISTAEVSQAVNNSFRAAQREDPSLDLATYVEQGGFDDVLNRLINTVAIAEYGNKHGMAASKRLVDGQIAKIPAFQGPDGAFSEEVFRRALVQQGVKEAALREDITRNLMAEQLLPVAGLASVAPQKLIMPYASLLLESRSARVATIPSLAFAPQGEPSPAELQAFYRQNSKRYMIPERRAVRYFRFTRDRFTDSVTPTEAEISGYYNLNKAKYAASERRTLQQVVVPTKAAATALVDKITGGTTIAAAAQQVGLSAANLGAVEKSAFAKSTSQAVADAAFAAKAGTVAPPAQSGLGWHVVRVDAVNAVAGRTLDQARGEIVAAVTREKMDKALAELTSTMEEEFSNGSTLDDIAKAENLTIVTTALLLADGKNPDDAQYRAPTELSKILPLAFSMSRDDDPQMVELSPGQEYGAVAIAEAREAAPAPLAQIENLVKRDFALFKGSAAAKAFADQVMKQKTDVSAALARSDRKFPPIDRVDATRADLTREGAQIPPAMALMFSMAQGTTKVLEAPDKRGWFIITLDKINAGDASKRPDLIQSTAQQFNQVLGQEYVEQFINAMKVDVGVKRNADEIKRLKAQLARRGGAS